MSEFTRRGSIIKGPPQPNVGEHKSINAAKRASRVLQAAGHTVRRLPHESPWRHFPIACGGRRPHDCIMIPRGE